MSAILTSQGHELVPERDLAAELHTPLPTLRYWRQIGKGPRWVKPGRLVLYRRQDVDDWLTNISQGARS